MKDNNPGIEMNTLPVTLSNGDSMLEDRREMVIPSSARNVYLNFISLGGDRGWMYFDWAWKLRGWFDYMIGGVGMRNKERTSLDLDQDGILDFWRVEEIIPDRLLRLRAEMKVPGKAWLQFEASPLDEHKTKLEQHAYFVPDGLGGLIYWYGLYPIHTLIFSGLIKRIAQSTVSED
jgi:hypothetical protein